MLLALAQLAQAGTDIGTEKTFGLGLAFGTGTYLNVNGKLWFNDTMGLAFHGGTMFVYHEIGAQIEGQIYRGEWFDWADMPIYWFVGIDAGLSTYYGGAVYPQVGVAGGAGAALQFSDFPLEAFVEPLGIDVYPLNYCSMATGTFVFGYGCGFGYRATAGGRWYF